MLVEKDNEDKEIFIKCIVDIIDNYASWNEGVLVSYEDEKKQNPILEKLIYKFSSLQIPVYILTNMKTKFIVVNQSKSKFAIILIDNVAINDTVASLEAQIKGMKSTPTVWNPRGRLIIALQNKVQRPSMKIRREIVAAAWRMQVVNFVVMFMPVRLDYFKIYSASPFSKGNCASVPNPSLVDICDNRSLVFHADDHFFQRNFYRYFPACTLTVFTPGEVPPYVLANPSKYSEIPYSDGVEVKMINLIAEVTKFSLQWVTENEIALYLKDTYSNFWANTDGDLACKDVEVVFGSLRPTIERATKCDMTHHYLAFTVSWFVPKAARDHSWAVHIKGVGLWLCLISGYLAASCLIVLFLKKNGNMERNVVLANGLGCNIFISIWSALQYTVKFVWRNFHIKFLFFCWVIFQVRVQTSLMSSIVSVLTRPSYAHQINTVKELLESDLGICVAEEYDGCREIFTDGDIVEMYRKSIICPNMTKAVEQLIEDRNISILGIEDYLLSLGKQVASNSHVIQENLAFFGLGIFLKRDSFYLEAFNFLIRKAMEAGLPIKWLRDVRQRESSLARNPDDVFVTLKMNNILPVFHILVMGWIIAIAIFCFELCIKYKPLNQLYKLVVFGNNKIKSYVE
ncbi:hypothetical protein J6590_001836 [Homalodisca vitripennis]|nr:hypothetical protein J6590_001836 [Homalodisca vitripennis]